MGQTDSPVVEAGVRFLVESMREDGSWPIDTNLSTWVTTLSIAALADAGALPPATICGRCGSGCSISRARASIRSRTRRPGAWAWTPLSGGVPDADDTSGALLALRRLGDPDPQAVAAAAAGVRWLLGVQNRDGGIPTFCRGWGALPFDRSTPEITAHALQAWSVWYPHFDRPLQRDLRARAGRAVKFLAASRRADGTWIPLWFGNEHAPDEDNPDLRHGSRPARPAIDAGRRRSRGHAIVAVSRSAGCWRRRTPMADGEGAARCLSSIEETGVVLAALGSFRRGWRCASDRDGRRARRAVAD